MVEFVLIDIEGTVGDAAFVKQVLFPHADRAMAAFVAREGHRAEVRAELEAAAAEGGVDRDDDAAIVALLRRWIREDRKVTALKALQGMIWRAGYERGDFQAHLYDDAYRALKSWRMAGIPLFVYSSGSVPAQELYFGHTAYGDLQDWFDGFFDTRVGPKQEVDSYRRIAAAVRHPADHGVFFSDVIAELDAAAKAGFRTAHIQRDGTLTRSDHPRFESFDEVDLEELWNSATH